jgi:hypothetical protein
MRSLPTLGRRVTGTKWNVIKWIDMWHAWNRRQNRTRFRWENLKERGQMGDLGADGRHIHVHRCDSLKSNLVCFQLLNGA